MATTTAPTRPPAAAPVDWTRKYAFATGLFYLVTFAASIPAAFYFLSPSSTTPATSSAPAPTPEWSSDACSTPSTPWPASPPPSPSTPWRDA